MIEIGLYNAKYPFRKLLHFLLGYFKNSNPNHVSLALLPIGLMTALLYYYAPQYPFLYCLGILFILIRMIVGTLDGMIAESFNKQTPNGTILNRLTPEAADMMLMAAIILSAPNYFILGIFSLIIIWGISYTGLLGLAGGKRIQSIGPAGQTDRIVALMLFSLLQMFALHYGWEINFITLFLWWVIIGGIITIALRCYRILTETSNEH
jgi:phosphatidylglycerophosphate synthase